MNHGRFRDLDWQAAQIRAQRHVVIQHRVHILDPNRINRTVKDSPLVVRALLMIQDDPSSIQVESLIAAIAQ